MKYSNIYLAYVLAVLHHGWFWLGIWVLYYLEFTTVAGIGILESIMIVTKTGLEIPTGALADLIGKRLTLAVSFGFVLLGSFFMGSADSFAALSVSIIILTVGGVLYSGSLEALVYDSLIDLQMAERFDTVIARINGFVLAGFAIFSVMGGYMYSINKTLPFYAQAILALAGLGLSLLLKEPQADTEVFSWKKYSLQVKQGFRQLFTETSVRSKIIALLGISLFIVIGYEMLNDVLAVEFGFSETQLGWLAGVIYIISAFGSQLSPHLKRKFGVKRSLLLVVSIIGLTYLISPFVVLYLGALTLILRYVFQAMFDNFASEIINKTTESKYRATTLSTFAMIKELPYVFMAYGLGYFVDIYSARYLAFLLGVLMLLLVLLGYPILTKSNRK